MYKLNPITGKLDLVTDTTVDNEPAKIAEFDGINKVFTTTNKFFPGSLKIQFDQLFLVPGVNFTDAVSGTINFLGDAPNPADGVLLFNYKIQ